MRSLPNRLIADWKRPLLLAVVAAVLILSLGVDCGPAAQVEFGYNYEHVTPPQWTPDGKHVVLSRYGAITVAALDGSGSFWRIHEVLDRLNDRSVRFDDSYAPNVSPDGTEVAYMHRYTRDDLARDLNYEIHVASLDGSNIRRLTENDYHEASPVWSPDNTRIAYWSSSLESPAWALMTMAKDGTDKRHVITIDRGDPPPVVWSPDGRRLAFVQFHRSVDVLEYASMSLARMDQIQQDWLQRLAVLSGLTTEAAFSLCMPKRMRIRTTSPPRSTLSGPMEETSATLLIYRTIDRHSKETLTGPPMAPRLGITAPRISSASRSTEVVYQG